LTKIIDIMMLQIVWRQRLQNVDANYWYLQVTLGEYIMALSRSAN